MVDEIKSGQFDCLSVHLKYGIQARATIINWLRKHDTFDWKNLSDNVVRKPPEHSIIALEAKVKFLEKLKTGAEHLAVTANKKVIIFYMLVDMGEKEYDIAVRKNYTPELLNSSNKNK